MSFDKNDDIDSFSTASGDGTEFDVIVVVDDDMANTTMGVARYHRLPCRRLDASRTSDTCLSLTTVATIATTTTVATTTVATTTIATTTIATTTASDAAIIPDVARRESLKRNAFRLLHT